MHLSPERAEDTGELDGDVAGADDRHPPRHRLQVERVVRNDAQFRARYVRTLRMATGGDDNRFGGDPRADDFDGVRIDEHRPGVEHRRTRAGQQSAVDALQPGDLPVLGGDQLAPVMRPLPDSPAEAGGVIRPAAILASLHQQLLRHAADIDAGATPVTLLGDAHAGAVAGGNPRAPHAGRTATDDEQVEIHAPNPFDPANVWPGQ